jgi:hypothetical protein
MGSPDTDVLIIGSGFVAGVAVLVGERRYTAEALDGNRLRFTLSHEQMIHPDTLSITVEALDGQLTNVVEFAIIDVTGGAP